MFRDFFGKVGVVVLGAADLCAALDDASHAVDHVLGRLDAQSVQRGQDLIPLAVEQAFPLDAFPYALAVECFDFFFGVFSHGVSLVDGMENMANGVDSLKVNSFMERM